LIHKNQPLTSKQKGEEKKNGVLLQEACPGTPPSPLFCHKKSPQPVDSALDELHGADRTEEKDGGDLGRIHGSHGDEWAMGKGR